MESVFDYASWCIRILHIYCSLPLQGASGRLKIFPHNPQTPSEADAAPVARMKCVHVTLTEEDVDSVMIALLREPSRNTDAVYESQYILYIHSFLASSVNMASAVSFDDHWISWTNVACLAVRLFQAANCNQLIWGVQVSCKFVIWPLFYLEGLQRHTLVTN